MLMYKEYLIGQINNDYNSHNQGFDPKIHISSSIFRNLEKPSATMYRDAANTTKPYKSKHGIYRDVIFQPFLGLWNLLCGAANITVLPFYLLAAALFFVWEKPKGTRAHFLRNTLKFCTLEFSTSLFRLFHGCTQIASWPFTLLRTPYRTFLTLKNDWAPLEESDSLRALTNNLENATHPTNERDIATILVEKTLKAAVVRKQKTTIDTDAVQDALAAFKSAQDNQNEIEAKKLALVGLFKTHFAEYDKTKYEKINTHHLTPSSAA